MTRLSILIPTAGFALALVLSGCTSPNPQFRAYCDNTGCFTCSEDGVCSAVPNTPCAAANTCPTDQVCTTIGCAVPCEDDNICGEGLSCVMGYCIPGVFDKVKPIEDSTTCSKDEDCSADMYCEKGTCISRCKSDDECAPGLVCVACGKCQKPSVPATCGEVPSYCSADTSCGAGKECVSGRCHFNCDGKTSCPVGQICAHGLCKDDPAPTSPECVLDLHCESGSCINGYCHLACANSGECASQELCLVGVCQPNYHPAK